MSLAQRSPDPLIAQLHRSCVLVEGKKNGCGFFISPDLLITCSHVVGRDALIGSFLPISPIDDFGVHAGLDSTAGPSDIHTLYVELVAKDNLHDLSLLRLANGNFPTVAIDYEVRLGDPLVAIGFPQINSNQILELDQLTAEFEGAVNQINHEASIQYLKFKGGQVRLGFSGSPLLNLRTCRVIGVVSETRSAATNLGGYAVPVEYLFSLLKQADLEISTNLDLDWSKAEQRFRSTNNNFTCLNLGAQETHRQVSTFQDPKQQYMFRIPTDRLTYGVLRGRCNELHAIDSHLFDKNKNRKRSLVFITGQSGIGKSALAYNYAANQANTSFSDGIIWVRFNGDSMYGDHLARDLILMCSNADEDEDEDDDPLARVRSKISAKRLLIVFDDVRRSNISLSANSQNILKGLIHELLPMSGGHVSVLITTQDRLLSTYFEIEGYNIDLYGLDQSSAIETLTDYADISRFTKSEFILLCDVARAFVYLPIALKILGSTIRIIQESQKLINLNSSHDEVIDFLAHLKNNQLELSLQGSEEDREWSVRACLKEFLKHASLDQSDRLRDFFFYLGLCSNTSITKNLAAQVSGYSLADTDRFLKRLHAFSILDGPIGKYSIHPLLHAYALHNLREKASKYDSGRQRHAMYILKEIKEVGSSKSHLTNDLDVVHANFELVVEWVEECLFSVSRVKRSRYSIRLILNVLRRFFPIMSERLFPRSFPDSYLFFIDVAKNINVYCENRYMSHSAVRILLPFLKIAEDLEDWESHVRIHLQVAKFYSWSNNNESALASLASITKILPRVAQKSIRLELNARLHIRKARTTYKLNGSNEAIKYSNMSVSLSRSANNNYLLRNALINRGYCLCDVQQFECASSDFEELTTLCYKLNDKNEAIKCLAMLDSIYYMRNLSEKSAVIHETLIASTSDIDSQIKVMNIYRAVASRFLKVNLFDGYEHAFKRSIRIHKDIYGITKDYVISVFSFGIYFGKRRFYADAIQYLCELTNDMHFSVLPDYKPLLHTLLRYGSILAKRGELSSAVKCFESVIFIAKATKSSKIYSRTLNRLGYLYIKSGDIKTAFDCFISQANVAKLSGGKRYQNGVSALGVYTLMSQYKFEFIDTVLPLVTSPISPYNLESVLNLLIRANDYSHVNGNDVSPTLIYCITSLNRNNAADKSDIIDISSYGLDFLKQYTTYICMLGNYLFKAERYHDAVYCLSIIPESKLHHLLPDSLPLLGMLRAFTSKLKDMAEYGLAIRLIRIAIIVSKSTGHMNDYLKCINILGNLQIFSGFLDQAMHSFWEQFQLGEQNHNELQTRYAISGIHKIYKTNAHSFVLLFFNLFLNETEVQKKKTLLKILDEIKIRIQEYKFDNHTLPLFILFFKLTTLVEHRAHRKRAILGISDFISNNHIDTLENEVLMISLRLFLL